MAYDDAALYNGRQQSMSHEIERQHNLIHKLIDSQIEALRAVSQSRPNPKAEIVEETSDDGKSITVYPCPKCGNSDPDWDASMSVKVGKLAEQFGWDRMTPLLDWLGDCLTDLELKNK